MTILKPLLFASTFLLAAASFASPEYVGPMSHERQDTPKKANAHVGRYLYVGAVPKFDTGEVDLTASKMSLTLRATGWLTQAKYDGYATQLYNRWLQIDTTFQDQRFVLHPLMKLMSMPTKDTSIAWAKIASQYSSHVLENRGVEIYNPKRNARALENAGITDEYRSNISIAILRYYFNDLKITPEAIKNDNALRDRLLSPENSRALFNHHYGKVFTKTTVKPGYIGNITLVYPIAATVEGPYDQPREGVRIMPNYGTVEARWWSDKWDDEFGGLPFILVNAAGVAFHGPITNFAPLDVWYLRRGYVSHGCHRMDSSDIIELRNLLPRKLTEMSKVKLTILNNFDVTDWNHDGKNEVIDVKYYNIPTVVGIPKGKTIDDMVKPFLVANQMKTYFQENAYSKKFYNPTTDLITGAPRYKVSKGILSTDGVHGPLPIARFEYQPSRVLQYKELGVQLVPFDDNRGNLPPTYFLKY